MNTTSGPFSKDYNTQKSLKVDISQTVTINLGLVILIFGWVKTLEWQALVQLSSTPTPGVFVIVTVLQTFHPCKWLDIVICSKDCLIADLSDHVFYGGCRLMHRPISRSTVDWHIGCYVCRDSVEYRPIVDMSRSIYRPSGVSCIDRQETPLGRYIDRLTIDTRTILDRISTDKAADMSINSRPRYRPIHHSTPPVKHIDRQSVVIVSVVCRQCIGKVSVVYRYWENEPTLILPIRVWGRGPKLI